MQSLQDCIDRFASAPLFQHVGEALDDDRVQQVRTWKAAIKRRTTGPGNEIYDRIMNRVRRFARTTRGEDWFNAEWNSLVVKVKAEIQARLQPIVVPLLRGVERGDLIEAHVLSTRWKPG